MATFKFDSTFPCVLFGHGTLSQLPKLTSDLGMRKVMILSTPEQAELAERVAGIAGDTVAGVFTRATMHTPTDITKQACAEAETSEADGIISVGGGSTTGLGKAICVRLGLPHLCVPTTYAGSEMTPILGETEDGRKTTRHDPKILPTAVLYDVDLTMTLPLQMSIYSGINAIAHSVEALYASNTNPIINTMAISGIGALSEGLLALKMNPNDVGARYKALYGAWLCGLCLGSVDMALHHKLCHTLGGTFDLRHAETHVAVLPHAIAYNASATPEAMEALAGALPDSRGDAVRGMNLLYRRLDINVTLKGLGMPEAGIDEAAEIAAQNPYKNPAPIERRALHELIRRAWVGEEAKALL